MTIWELILIALGLSMDALAVAISLGVAMPKATWRKALVVGLYFGAFQAAMPALGYLVARQFASLVISLDHWIAFVLLLLIGGKMVVESFGKDKCDDRGCPSSGACDDRDCPSKERDRRRAALGVAVMLPLAVATSIDALAVGVTFAFLDVQILPAVLSIGAITLALSTLGVIVGKSIGSVLKSKAELVGGIILIIMGAKILIEHLGVFA